MDRPYRHFTLEERRTLFRLLNAKLPIKEIAGQHLGRPILAAEMLAQKHGLKVSRETLRGRII